ncbi:MAG: phosphoglycerate kinase [Planctomycetota bacterium]
MHRLEDLLELLPRGGRVLARLDLNVPLERGLVSDGTRLDAAVPTVRALLSAGARLVLCSHLGRPKGVDPQFSLAPVAVALGERLGQRVGFVAGHPGDEAVVAAAARLQPGEVLLLDNLRFHPGEKGNDPGFARALAALADVYVNDAFGTAHRSDASVVGVPALLPGYVGLLVERELDVLSRLRTNAERPFWVILGGAKVADKLGVVRQLRRLVDGFIVGGGMANTFLAGLGQPVGESRIESEWLGELRELVEDQGSGHAVEWLFPTDFVAGNSLDRPSEVKVVQVGEEPGPGFAFFDIGPRSIAAIEQRLATARTVFWNGPLGVFEVEPYQQGTQRIAECLARLPGERVLGGGDTAAAARRFHVDTRVSHVSTGGGASLEYLEGKILPGVQALENARRYLPH